MERSFEPLTVAENEWVEDQLELARDFLREFGPDEPQPQLTLEALDSAFQKYLTSNADPSTANGVMLAIGAAFGARLVHDLGFRWVVVTDDYGTDLAVLARPGRGDVIIVPADFVG